MKPKSCKKATIRSLRNSFWSGCLASGLVSSLGASTTLAAEGYRPAEAAFDQGQFAQAGELYGGLAAQGIENGHLYYNLGIVTFRQGQLGDAIAYFLGARRLLPRDPDVAANLKLAEKKIRDRLDSNLVTQNSGPLAPWYRLLNAWSLREWAIFATILVALWGAFATALILKKSWAPYRSLALYGLLMPILGGIFFIGKSGTPHHWGAVRVAAGAKVHAGPSPQESVLFELHEGAPILKRGTERQGYLPIEISDGRRGWIAAAAVRVL